MAQLPEPWGVFPFGPPVMQQVVAQLQMRADALWVVYVNPRCGDLFADWMERLPLTPAQAALFTEGSVAIFHRAQTTRRR